MKKLLYFTINRDSKDTSGLPTYSEAFIHALQEHVQLIIINVISDLTEIDRIEQMDNGFNIYCGHFFGVFSSDVNNIVKEVISLECPDIVLMQDYIFEPYMTQFYGKQTFKKIFFMHLCQSGLMHAFTKQPFFDVFLRQGMSDLSQRCWLEWKSIMTSDLVICNSEFSKREIHKFYPEYYNPVIAAPLGVDVDNLEFCPALDSNKWVYFGRLDAQKGINYIIKDFVEYPEEYKANPLVVIGDGIMDNQIIKACFFDHYVDYKGNLTKESLFAELRDAKYCIFPSIYEPFGLALNEALAMGKICIINAIDSGMLEQLRGGPDANAFSIQFGQDSIIKSIEQIEAMDSQILKDVTVNGRKHAYRQETHFSLLKQIIC